MIISMVCYAQLINTEKVMLSDVAKIVESTHQDQGFGGILSGVHAGYVVCDIDLEHNFDENPLADHCKCD